MATAALSRRTGSEQSASLLYEPLDFVLVRTPLLPIQAFLDLGDEGPQLALLANHQVVRALAIASPSLVGAIERFKRSGLTQRDAARMLSRLLRYQIRMATRPTPFGMFAGVALGHWGSHADLRLLTSCAEVRTRPDMPELMSVVLAAEENPNIRKRLRFFTNPLANVFKGRVTLPERAPTGHPERNLPVSVRATRAVQLALSAARAGVAYPDLVAEIIAGTPSATLEKVDTLLEELWRQTLLLTDLRPPLTTGNPSRHVADRLSGIPEAAELSQKIEKLLFTLQAWDRLDSAQAVARLPFAIDAASKETEESQENVAVQVDMAARLEGQLGPLLASEAARAAELLLRVSPSPRGLSSVAAYRNAYVNRYGHDRRVPLLELVDEQRGLGSVSKHGHSYVGPDSAKSALRSQTLLRLACTALYQKERVVELDERTITSLETWRPSVTTAPLSLDVNFLVGARSVQELDRGNFSLVIGPNLGALAAGRNLGRFADLLKPLGRAALLEIAGREQEHGAECICAEVVWMPQNFRSANVVIRPSVRAYEVLFGLPANAESEAIPLDELDVGIDDGRFAVWWRATGKRVVFRAGHMLNHYAAPAAARFLLDLSYDGKALFSSFDWGPAESFPFLPRVQVGRIVLRPAQWRITSNEPDLGSAESLENWRVDWDVPRYVCLSVGDNRLVLDLDNSAQAGELVRELKGLSAGSAIIIQEVLPSFEDTWLCGPDGTYCSEFVASLVLRETGHQKESTAPMPASALMITEHTSLSEVPRVHPPGGHWLFLKLYAAREIEDDLIADSLLPFADQAVAAGLADSWFFIRYSDPDPHLRLRFHGLPEQLNNILFGHVCDWAGGLLEDGLAGRFLFDSYEQEVERFGGFEAMPLAEKIFHVDSQSAALLIRCGLAKQWSEDKTTLLALSVDDLLCSLGLDRQSRLHWYRKHAVMGGPDVGADYRKRKGNLRTLLGQTSALRTRPGGKEIDSVFTARRSALAEISDRYRELEAKNEMRVSLGVLFDSLVHLHFNRVAGIDQSLEQKVLSLLLRTHESLDKAPLRSGE